MSLFGKKNLPNVCQSLKFTEGLTGLWNPELWGQLLQAFYPNSVSHSTLCPCIHQNHTADNPEALSFASFGGTTLRNFCNCSTYFFTITVVHEINLKCRHVGNDLLQILLRTWPFIWTPKNTEQSLRDIKILSHQWRSEVIVPSP